MYYVLRRQKMSAVTPEFVKFYNLTFKTIGNLYDQFDIGEKNLPDYLIRFWIKAKDILLADLKELVKEKDIWGCAQYWDKVLQEENADYCLHIFIDETKQRLNTFTLEMKDCPSCRILGKDKYKRYCEHCEVMYPALFDELGYNCTVDVKGNGKCNLKIKARK